MTFLACALHQLFVRSCHLAHHGLCFFTCLCFVHITARCSISLFGVCLRHFLVLTWMNLSTCGCLLAPLSGITLTTRAIRSQHFTLFNSYKLVRAGPASSSSMSYRQVTHSAISPQVQMDPTRTFTSDLLSATLAEAATQLFFAAFLERCIFVHASPPPQLPVPTPSLDAATQTFSHTAASGDVSTHATLVHGVLVYA